MLVATDLTKTFPGPDGPVPVLRGLSLTVEAGAFVAVRGPSGCGKSTLLLILGGMLRPDAGRVTVAGQDLYALSASARGDLRARAIGMVFQRFHQLPYLDVRDNVLLPACAGPLVDPGRADLLIERFGLTHRRHHRPDRLSTGERQRTALARALLHQPGLILADEPTGNLDPDNARLVVAALREAAGAGAAVVLVTHDPVIAAAADRVVELGR